MTKGRTALIAGASGLVGGQLLTRLLDSPAYDRVISVGRRSLPIDDPKLTQLTVDFTTLDLRALPAVPDEIFCALGTTIRQAKTKEAFRQVDQVYVLALARLARAAGASFHLVSSLGADPTSGFFYMKVKGEVEAELKSMGLPSLHIYQPSLLLGHRKQFRLGEAIASAVSPLYNLLMMGPLRKYRGIQAADVAAAMVAAAAAGKAGAHTYESDRILAIARGRSKP